MSKIRNIYCNRCQHETKHEILFDLEKDYSSEAHFELYNYYFAECCGCGMVKLQIIEQSSACDMDEHGHTIPEITIYPPKTLRPRPHWFYTFILQFLSTNPDSDRHAIPNLLGEIYIALQNKCPRLAVMGIRALLEHIMIDKCGDKGSFKNNIDAFQNDGYISKI